MKHQGADARPDGVYFDLDEDTYHADPALGSTDIRKLLISPSDYWWGSWMNPLKEAEPSEPSPALQRGKAFHKLILEGTEAFVADYARGINQDEFPELLVTADDLKTWLKAKGRAATGIKSELVTRALAVNPDLKVYDHMLSCLRETGKIILPYKDYDRVVVSSAMIVKNPNLQKAFSGGRSEVSVFWTIDGVRVKCRFDHLKIRAIGDLKSFQNIKDKPLEAAINNAIWGKRYDIQGSHYHTGRAALAGLVGKGDVFGDHDPDWFAKVAQQEKWTFVFVFYQSTSAPIAHGFQFNRGTTMDQTAQAEISRALDLYKSYFEKFGTDTWISQEPIHVMTPSDVPAWVGR